MLNMLKKILGTKNDRDLKAMKPLVVQINAFEPKMKAMSDEELKNQTVKFRSLLDSGTPLASLIPEAFATVREASIRVLGLRHFDVQMMGGIVLYQNKIAEMKTGEGKTLTATLPLYLHGLTHKGGHVVTVNDYLANRDAVDMGRLFTWLGLTVGCILTHMSDEERKQAYAADITYGTNNEFAFDYLRDNMKFSLEDYVQREHNFCIVDEVDSILIDEARTPLLISGPSEGDTGLYKVARQLIPQLVVGEDFTLDEKAHSTVFTDAGINKIQKILRIDNLFNIQHSSLLHHINQALKAFHLFKLDVHYVIKEGKIVIVDEFTGRLKEGSRWSDGLHQSVEAKENVEIRSENQTLASITFQNYFRLYNNLAGMTGTADTEAEEFNKIYNLDVVVVPTNVLMIRDDQADVIYKTKNAKLKAITNLIKDLHTKGQPVLVGTISIENSEVIANQLQKLAVPHEVLNAKNHAREAEIIKNAGQKKSVTIATNMAGRGTDIKLSEETRALGGLFIMGTERHEARRIDNQLRGRSGRQGDPGCSKFFLSLEDDLMRIFGSERIKGIMTTMGMEDDEPIEHKMITNAIARAQKKVEAHNFEIRKHLLEYDNVMNEQRRVIYRIRRDILGDQDNLGFVKELLEDVVLLFVDNYRPQKKVPVDSWPWAELASGFKATFNTEITINLTECNTQHEGDIEKYISAVANSILEKKLSSYEPEQVKLALREILLSIFDHHWKDHLLSMDHLKEGINLRAYAQKDPLTEYKREAFSIFEDMRVNVKKAIVDQIFKVHLYTKEEIAELKRQQEAMLKAQLEAHRQAQQAAERAAESGKANPIKRATQKVGRNDLCPCGSGKKYKHCHGA
ncbi:MAG: preprotein translocase subunit SecA [Bdellovibrionales bacterium GWA2_49_15]|nr:MAG: preprotein translocase subunit SecA [Bdellovibrionales bacterium GWA2_49_15]HAZ13339.1 preprotein translocase subunit SecA [Bdellovibrionales bacterium]